MPSIAAHMVMAKLVGEKLNINCPEFIRGNLLPDVTLEEDSHHKIQGKIFKIPDADYFKDSLDLQDQSNLGYYVHLLLDKYFLEDFVPNNISNLEVFRQRIMYREYDIVNYHLVRVFELDIPYLKSVLTSYEVPVKRNKLNANLDFLSRKATGETTYLNAQTFEQFLQNVAPVIIEEVEKYASEPKTLSIGTRKWKKWKH